MSISVVHYGSLAAATGGPAYSTYLSMKGVEPFGISSKIIMPPLKAGEPLIANDVPVSYAHGSAMKQTLAECNADLFHIQGVWMLDAHKVASFARHHSIPYIIALRGMLYPQALQIKPLKKRIAMLLYQSEDLRKAACVQATCPEELEHFRKLGFRTPVAIIPNAVDLSDMPAPQQKKDSVFRVGYLGRIDPRKRIERILYALASETMKGIETECVIMGAWDSEYEAFLKKEVDRLGLRNVSFPGFLLGNDKLEAIRSLSVLVVPSDFENFGNNIVEALKQGVPCIASTGTPWQDLEQYHCGRWVPNDVPAIASAMKELAVLSPDERLAMSGNAQRLLQDKFELSVVSRKLSEMYQWIISGGTTPDFVEI
ncbi:MAG: glycosyltransferase [Lentisphaeria bacterium]|nr:glycosyltransferase [Lentisphaeria bacterium]